MTTDLTDRVRHLAEATDPARDPITEEELRQRRQHHRPHRPGRALVSTAAAALVALLAVAAVVIVTGNSTPDKVLTEAPPAPEGANATLLAPGEVRALPPAPIEGRSEAATTWTGSEVFIWGGSSGPDQAFADGATYDVGQGAWTVLPPAPLAARSSATAVWTGSEVIVWGGHPPDPSGDGTGLSPADGAAYDPVTRTWRMISSAPMASAGGPRAVWTGTEMLVLAGFNAAAGAAYDPTRDTWRTIAPPPGALVPPYTQALWTGDRLVAALQDPTPDGHAAPPAGGGLYAYDPATGAWQPFPEGPSFSAADQLLWTGDQVLLLPRSAGAPPRALDLATGRWSDAGPAAPSDIASAAGKVTGAWTGRRALLWSSGIAAAFDPTTGTWTTSGQPNDGADTGSGASTTWADGVLFTWGGFPAVSHGAIIRPPDPDSPAARPAPATAPETGPARPTEPTRTSPPPEPDLSIRATAQAVLGLLPSGAELKETRDVVGSRDGDANHVRVVAAVDGVDYEVSIHRRFAEAELSDPTPVPGGKAWPGTSGPTYSYLYYLSDSGVGLHLSMSGDIDPATAAAELMDLAIQVVAHPVLGQIKAGL